MESLTSDIASLLLNTEESGDMILVCGDGEVKAHRNIMSARSPAFKAMLESEMKEKKSGRVEVKDFGKSVVKAMVQFIYTAEIDEEIEDIVELMKIGNKYLIKSLVNECGLRLAKDISKDNVLDLEIVADSFSAENLLKSCANFAVNNLEVLGDGWEKLLKDSPMFLCLLRCLKEEDVISLRLQQCVHVSRFPYGVGQNMHHLSYGVKHEAIKIELNKAATLISVGLFGTNINMEIPVKVEILNKELETIFSTDEETVYKCTGSSLPVYVPLNVKMEAATEYTVRVLISSGGSPTYSGAGGQAEVKSNNNLTVLFKQSPMSTNGTTVQAGQIPSLCFMC